MRTETIEFPGAGGQRLVGRLDRPDGVAHAFALFAHCFTCDKGSKAAVRISQALAGLGVAVLRFDFTGLGDSEGEIAGFSAEVSDLTAAARHMESLGLPPTLLIGHSLGGAAVLAAAAEIPSAKAVATIGAPSEPSHVLALFGDALPTIEADGSAEVRIGGRPFTITRAFVQDARLQDLTARIQHLGKALLVLHSPIDEIVGVDNAAQIFLAARHPKSFVSLDKADHLLRHGADADYAAQVIAAWAGKYVATAPDPVAAGPDGAVLIEETGAGKFQTQVSAGGARFVADEPIDVGGLGTGPSPYELVAAGLGACTSMTARLYAERKGWPLKRTRVAVRHGKLPGQTPPDVFDRRIGFEGPLSAEQIARLFEIADKCPVHETLKGGARVVTGPLLPPPPPAVTADADDHYCEMDTTCRDNGAPG